MSAVAERVELPPAQVPVSSTRKDFSERSLIDQSCRAPVLFFYTSAVLWLLLGTLLGFLASYKMHEPAFWDAWAPLNFGRIRPAHLNVVAYGWATQAGLGTAIWLMARLSRTTLANGWMLIVANVFYNLGLTVGIIGILFGSSTSVEWLEMPGYASFIMFISFALVAIWGIHMVVRRREGHIYVSQWYLFAALFWFPWLFATANILLHTFQLSGVSMAATNWWYGHNVLGLWFTPIGLASAYYFIPKVVGRPVYSYYLSALGFWSLALFYSWNGMHHLIGGPFPAWLVTASIVASFMMVIPVVVVAINHHMTMKGSFHLLKYSPTLRFTVVGAMAYTLVSLQGISMSSRTLNEFTHFTHHTIGHSHLGLYAFFSMVMFGAMYYIVPRLVGCEWRSAMMIKIHFWMAFYGIALMFGALTAGGFAQGFSLENPAIPFNQVVEGTIPYLVARTWSGVMLTIAHFVFAIHFALMLFRLGKQQGSPTMFQDSPTALEEAKA